MKSFDPLGAVWTYGWCAEIGGGGGAGCSGGNCAGGGGGGSFCELTDPLGNTTRQDFDALGRVTEVTDPLGNTRRMSFDERGREVAKTDALGRTTRYEYDDLDRLVADVFSGSLLQSGIGDILLARSFVDQADAKEGLEAIQLRIEQSCQSQRSNRLHGWPSGMEMPF